MCSKIPGERTGFGDLCAKYKPACILNKSKVESDADDGGAEPEPDAGTGSVDDGVAASNDEAAGSDDSAATTDGDVTKAQDEAGA